MRMRTARSSTVRGGGGCLLGGGVRGAVQGGGRCCLGGGGVERRCQGLEGGAVQGRGAVGGEEVLSITGSDIVTPPVNRMTDRQE